MLMIGALSASMTAIRSPLQSHVICDARYSSSQRQNNDIRLDPGSEPHHGEAGAFLARLDCGRLLKLIDTLTSAYKPCRRQG